MAAFCPSLIESFGPALCEPVDIYCERTSASFFAEPLNAISNLAFLFAAWAAWREFRRVRGFNGDSFLAELITVIAIVGLGSFAFHTLATRWAEWGDVIPILVFMLMYLWLAMRRYLLWPKWLAAILLVLFFTVTFGIEARVPEQILWGGAMYLPTVAALIAIAFAPIEWTGHGRQTMFAAVACFLISFAFRTLDAPICPTLPIGTHYAWHILNATLLYLLLHVAIRHGRPVTRAVPATAP
jgi:ceramidase